MYFKQDCNKFFSHLFMHKYFETNFKFYLAKAIAGLNANYFKTRKLAFAKSN
ncbi:hypothetical protein CGEO_1672 [Campylobacter geochelonis]|nr:hypothetical protein CGEO_1672 [Campylobacter geochelonis]